VRHEKALRRAEEDRNIPHAIKGRMVSWIGHILGRNWILKRITVDKIGERERERERSGGKTKKKR
jgi:hypothetical protein